MEAEINTRYTLRFDGLFRRLPGELSRVNRAGFMSYGWLVFQGNTLIARGHGVVARGTGATSTVAEYLALIEGLEALLDLGIQAEGIKVCGDAKCVIEQMRGEAAVKAGTMIPMHRRAMRLAQRFAKLRWIWTPRRQNKGADSLTRLAMRQMRQDKNRYLAAVQAIDPTRHDRMSSKFLPLVDLRVYQPGETAMLAGLH